MPFYRKDFETLRAEEIAEADLRQKLAGYYKDVDLVIREMVENKMFFRTTAAFYWFNPNTVAPMDIYTNDKDVIYVDDGKDVWGLKFREVSEAKTVLSFLTNVGFMLTDFEDLKDSVRHRFPKYYFEEEHVMKVPQVEMPEGV